ncbi:MAG: hypothetical protein PWP63_2166 [Methanolobus sp.]|nr:hypothetical protein [Methanolobus sp.]
MIGMLSEQSSDLLHFCDAESISFADSSRMSAIMVSTAYSGRPMGVVMDTIPAALDDMVLVVVVTVLVSMFSPLVLSKPSY